MNDLHFGVCVGIDRYPGLAGRDLGSARRDAEAFHAWLIDPAGGAVPPENARLITAPPTATFPGPTDAHPQQAEVNRALKAFNTRLREHLPVHPEDWPRTRMYLYAAGHGVGPPNGEAALLMADADPEMLGDNIELSLYVDWYLHCGLVHEVVIFADCCREIVGGIPPASAPPFSICAYPAYKGAAWFKGYATRLGEGAWEPTGTSERDAGRGYFTRAVLDGLRNLPGEVTTASLAVYVQQAVEDLTRSLAPFPQRGEMLGDLAVPIVLRGAPAAAAVGTGGGAAVPGTPTQRVTIHFPATFAGEVLLEDGDLSPHGRWRATDGDWSIDLPTGLYQVVEEPAGTAAFQGQGMFRVAGRELDVQL